MVLTRRTRDDLMTGQHIEQVGNVEYNRDGDVEEGEIVEEELNQSDEEDGKDGKNAVKEKKYRPIELLRVAETVREDGSRTWSIGSWWPENGGGVRLKWDAETNVSAGNQCTWKRCYNRGVRLLGASLMAVYHLQRNPHIATLPLYSQIWEMAAPTLFGYASGKFLVPVTLLSYVVSSSSMSPLFTWPVFH